jgi:hypothetical protein
MCTNAAGTAASLFTAIEPTIKSLLSLEGLLNTPQGVAAIAAYDAALTALQNWKSGTTAQNVLQLIGAFQSVFNALPMPPMYSTLVNIVLAGVETVIGILTANSPAPVVAMPADANATLEERIAAYQAQVAKETEAKVMALAPGFKRSLFHSVAHQYNSTWNKAVDAGGFPATLKV